MARTPIATDDFNRADGDVGANWAQLYSFWGTMTIDSNQVRGTAGSDANMSAARWVGAGSFTDDQYSSLEISAGLGFGNAIGVTARASADTDANRDLYYMRWSPNTGSTELGKIVNGTETSLHTSTSPTWSTNDRIEIEVEGTTVRGLKNGVVVSGFSVTDSDLSTGTPGVCGAQAANDPKGDNWEGGNLTAGGGSSLLPKGISVGVAVTRASYF